MPLLAGCNKTEIVQNSPVDNIPASEQTTDANRESPGTRGAQAQAVTEPEVTGRLSRNSADAEGKKLTRCEYRYLNKNGEFVSVVADIQGSVNIHVTERKSADGEEKVYRASRTLVPDAKRIDEYLHKLDTYGRQPGPLMWVDAPERANWMDDESTTWLIMNYEDVQFIVSSRQELPEDRYKAFNIIYTYLTSFVSGFDRKMRQNIGAPAPDIIKEVHGKKVKLVPGTGNSVLTGAEINYGDKKWWIEEEFVGRFESTQSSLKQTSEETEEGVEIKAAMKIEKDGNFTLKINDTEYVGSLGVQRLYQVAASANMVVKSEKSAEIMKENGRILGGDHLFIEYEGCDDVPEYGRLRLFIEGTPYVEGRGYTPSQTIFIDRQ